MKIFFRFERKNDNKQPDPHNIKILLLNLINKKYNKIPLSDIPLTTELYIKGIGGKKLEYRVINDSWYDTRNIKNLLFSIKMFNWTPNTDFNGDENIVLF